jgi:hypothetical protein
VGRPDELAVGRGIFGRHPGKYEEEMNKSQKALALASRLRRAYRDGKLSQSKVSFLKKHGFKFDFINIPTSVSKDRLLQMAIRGEPRPSSKTKLGTVLIDALRKNNKSSDPIFAIAIHKANPSWFVKKSDITNQKKEELYRMAKNGEDRPSQDTIIGRALSVFTCKKHGCYDAVFDAKIRQIRPDWFMELRKVV